MKEAVEEYGNQTMKHLDQIEHVLDQLINIQHHKYNKKISYLLKIRFGTCCHFQIRGLVWAKWPTVPTILSQDGTSHRYKHCVPNGPRLSIPSDTQLIIHNMDYVVYG
uniref:Uncharacterized protein n=1 Tax=Cacopsylla melanoneura TaxID=428564 RepID=A0A8D8YY13_9HEMI